MTFAILQFIRRWSLELALLLCAAHLGWQVYDLANPHVPGVVPSQRNENFPDTYISLIHLDLTSPNHWVRLVWSGPQAASQDRGPFRSCPGAGAGMNNCDDWVESNCPNSLCTPKGRRKVEGLMDHIRDTPGLRYATVIDKRRGITFHSHPSIPPYPASAGCVRLEPYAARLIHDNSIPGKTEILIDGTWTNPNSSGRAPRASEMEVEDET